MGGLDFLNEMSGAKRKSYSGAFQLMPLLKFLVKRAGREFGICEKIAQDRLGLQSMHAFALPCCIALTSSHLLSGQAWLGLLLCRAGSVGALFSVWLSVRLHSSNYRYF